MASGAHRSSNIWIARRALVVAAATIGLVAVVTGGSGVRAAPPVAPPPPADVTVQCADDVPEPVALTAVDSPGTDITVSTVDVSTPGDTTNEFVIERTWTFTNTEGESSSVSQTITVDDTTPPVFDNVPGDETVIRRDNIPDATKLDATDNCDGPIQSGDPLDDPATPSNDQVITRTWTVTDEAGNAATATQTITVVPTAADLQITASANPDPVTAGESLAYTITVTNEGPDTATEVQVTTPSIVGASTSGCTNDPAGAESCTLNDLENNESAIFTVTVPVPADTKGNLVQTWQVSSLLFDTDTDNNTAATDVSVTAEAAMFVTAAVVVTEASSATTTAAGSSSALAAGDPVGIDITVGNNGPSAATDATVAATFTSSITNLAVVDDGLYTCQITSQVLSCTLASHPVGTTVVIRLSGALTSTSTDVFLGPVTVDSASGDAATTSSILVTVIPPTSTTVATTTTDAPTTTISTTTISTTTTTVAPAVPATAPPSSGTIPATGADNGNVIRASIIALLAGLAAVIAARRRHDLVASLRPAGWSTGHQAELPTRRVTSNGVSTVIEEPTRRTPKR